MIYWADEEKKFKLLINILRDRMDKNKRMELHTHDFIEIEYVMVGEGTQNINGKNLKVHRGDIVFLNKGDCHTYWTDSYMEILNVVFYFPIFEEIKAILKLYSTADEVEFPVVMHARNDDILFIEDLLLKAEQEFDGEKPGYFHVLKSYLTILLLYLQRSAGELDSQLNYKMPIILEFIDRNYAHISVPMVAEHFGYSPNYFSKLFKKETGTNFTDYVNKLRINKAIEMLTGTENSIDDISSELGFNDKKHFYETFKKHVGVTPGTLRKNKR